MKRKQWSESKYRRTRSWQRDPDFDREVLGYERTISGLKHLRNTYNIRIREYPNFFDLNDEENQEEYEDLIRHRDMINDEINYRYKDKDASPTFRGVSEYFDSETGLVYNSEGEVLYSIVYNEKEDGIIYNTFIDEYEDIIDTPYFKRSTNKSLHDIYKDWDYTDDIDE